MSAFKQHPRGRCPDCDRRVLVSDLRGRGVCYDCFWKAMERDRKDEERRSLRFATDEQLERF